MTRLFDTGPGPKLHALVVGVGDYPHCFRPERQLTADARRLAETITPLTSAPLSARAVVEWLVGPRREDPLTPLGSLETLISDPAGIVAGEVRATRSNFADALYRWQDRCDEDVDNVAFFFFCGHGWEDESSTILLEDFAAEPHRLFGGAVDLRNIHRGMRSWRARTQALFVDACRDRPDLLEPFRETAGESLLPAFSSYRAVPPRDLIVVRSSAPGQAAFGEPGLPSDFTRVLLRALEGSGAAHLRSGPGPGATRWQVDTAYLGIHMRTLWRSCGLAAEQDLCIEGESTGGRPLRTFAGPPTVPFDLGCDPESALKAAELALAADDASSAPMIRGPEDARWLGSLSAGYYHFSARFPGGDYHPARKILIAAPPFVEEDIEVRQR